MSRRLWLVLAFLVSVAALVAWFAFGNGATLLLRRDATWDQMLETRDLRVGLDPSFPPFEQLNAEGLPEGFDVDLAHALAERWGIVAKINPIGFDSLTDALRASRIDAVISAMPYDERLTEDVNFSPAYFEAGIRLAVRPDSAIDAVDDLEGARVAVEWGSAGDSIARTLLRDGEVVFEIVPFDTPQEAIDAASAATGEAAVDALLIDGVSLRLAQGQGAPLVAVGPALESNPYVIVTPGRAGTLAAEVAAALVDFAADGTLAAIEERWFGAAPAARGAAEE